MLHQDCAGPARKRDGFFQVFIGRVSQLSSGNELRIKQ